MIRKKTPITVSLKPMKVVTISENWSEYQIEDGTKLKIRPVIVEIERHEGRFTPEGEPIYEIKAGVIMNLKSNIKSKPKKKKS